LTRRTESWAQILVTLGDPFGRSFAMEHQREAPRQMEELVTHDAEPWRHTLPWALQIHSKISAGLLKQALVGLEAGLGSAVEFLGRSEQNPS
jgi:hypothetical protein